MGRAAQEEDDKSAVCPGGAWPREKVGPQGGYGKKKGVLDATKGGSGRGQTARGANWDKRDVSTRKKPHAKTHHRESRFRWMEANCCRERGPQGRGRCTRLDELEKKELRDPRKKRKKKKTSTLRWGTIAERDIPPLELGKPVALGVALPRLQGWGECRTTGGRIKRLQKKKGLSLNNNKEKRWPRTVEVKRGRSEKKKKRGGPRAPACGWLQKSHLLE